MKRVLRDHGDVLHKAGGLGLFPVRGPDGELAFAHHGALEGRRPIGWSEFFIVKGKGRVVVLDDEEVSAVVVTEEEAIRELGDAARKPPLIARMKHALGSPGEPSAADS